MLNSVDCGIGHQLKMRRKELGFSRTELATKAGITPEEVKQQEKGAKRISAAHMYIYKQLLKVELRYFFEGFQATWKATEERLRRSVNDNR